MNVYKRCRPILGTFVEISLFGKNPSLYSDSVTAAFAAIEEVSRIMSFHNVQSDLSGLNNACVGQWVRVSPKLVEILNLALELQKKSQGIFNVAIAEPLILWNFLPGKVNKAGFKYLRAIGFETCGKQKVRRLLPVKIDLGGIAKGYAVDQAVKILKKNKNISGCVNAGGDLRAFGGLPQSVCVRSRDERPRADHFTSIKNKALATSEIIPRLNKSPYVDILNKKAHLCKKTAVIMAQECVIADALTKIALLSPPGLARKVVTGYGAEMRIIK